MSVFALERTPGETRAVALNDAEQFYSVFVWREPVLEDRPGYQDVCAGIVRHFDKPMNGVFVEISSGMTVFCRLKKNEKPPSEGARVRVEIVAEAFADKLARGVLTHEDERRYSQEESLSFWMNECGGSAEASEVFEGRDARALIDEAFEEAENPRCILSNGGELYFDFARAGILVDVDTSGRMKTSGRGDINFEALSVLARQVSLRRLGGIVITDLVGSVNPEASKKLVSHFRNALAAYDKRRANILPVNRLGLFEFALPRLRTPIFPREKPSECSLDRLVSFWRAIHRKLEDDRAATVSITVSAEMMRLLKGASFDWEFALSSKFGARFQLTEDDALAPNTYVLSP